MKNEKPRFKKTSHQSTHTHTHILSLIPSPIALAQLISRAISAISHYIDGLARNSHARARLPCSPAGRRARAYITSAASRANLHRGFIISVEAYEDMEPLRISCIRRWCARCWDRVTWRIEALISARLDLYIFLRVYQGLLKWSVGWLVYTSRMCVMCTT